MAAITSLVKFQIDKNNIRKNNFFNYFESVCKKKDYTIVKHVFKSYFPGFIL